MEFEKEIVKDLGNFQKLIDLGNSLDRLKNNPDFNKVITQGYLHDLVLDLLFKHNGDNNSDYYQKLDSIKFLHEYLALVDANKLSAEQSKLEYELELNNQK